LERLVAILSEDHADGVQPANGDLVVMSDDAGESWSTVYQSQHAIPGATIDEDGVMLFGSPEDGLYRLALGDVGDIHPLLVSMTRTRGLAAAVGKVYSIGDEDTDGYSV